VRQTVKRKRERLSAVERRFPTESALCDEFTALARTFGYRVYPECSGWDLLLVDAGTGLQVGVQAKLKANPEVLLQALRPSDFSKRGPDVHAVLVADHLQSSAWCSIARELRLLVIAGTDWVYWKPMLRSYGDYRPRPVEFPVRELIELAPRWEHSEREWVPDFEVHGMSGGASGPRQLTPWKIAAVKLCRTLRIRGYLTRADFERAHVSIQRWVYAPNPWLRSERHGKQFRYIATGHPLPDDLYPEVAAALAASEIHEATAV
jgi:hypothetical protein